MIQVEHFVYGLFNGVGYKTLSTSLVDKLLTEQNLETLKRLPVSGHAYIHWLETEKLVALSQVKPAWDEFNRKGVWNHTLLIRISNYLVYTQTRPANTLHSYFFMEQPKPSIKLEPIEIK